MRFLQAALLEMPYRAWFSSRYPALVAGSHGDQVVALARDGATPVLTQAIAGRGHTTFLCFANDGVSQGAWAREHDLAATERANPDAILRRQVAAFAPDIVCLDPALARLAPLIREAAPRVLLAARIIAGDPPQDLGHFDAILADRPPATLEAHKLPVHVAPLVPPATIEASPPVVDVLIRVNLKPTDRTLIALLLAVTKAPLGFGGEFAPALQIQTLDAGGLPIGLTMYDRGPVYGEAFRKAASAARIVVDVDDGAGGLRLQRILEAVAAGACVLAQDSAALRGFLPGLVTFTTADDLLEKIYAVLRDDGRRAACGEKLQAATAGYAEAAATAVERLANHE